MVRAQAEAVVAAASQPILIQVAQEAAMKDMASRFQGMTERLLSDPEIRRSAEDMQQKLMSDPETRELLEELMRRLGITPTAPLRSCCEALGKMIDEMAFVITGDPEYLRQGPKTVQGYEPLK